MKTVGSILKEAREAKHLTFEQVETATKIRAKFLVGIESDDYSSLPSLSYAKGFVKNYAEYLGYQRILSSRFSAGKLWKLPNAILPKGVAQSLNRAWFQLTPGKFLIFLFVGFVVLFLIYLGIQYGQLRNPPILAIDVPLENAIVATKKVELLGSTDPDATVMVNGISILVRGDGKFFDQIALEPGTNIITVIATSRYGKTSLVKRTVTSQTEETNPR